MWRLSYLLEDEYQSIAEINLVWSAASARTQKLTSSMRLANAPVNDVFGTLKVDFESNRFQVAIKQVIDLIDDERRALQSLEPASVQLRLLANIDDAEKHVVEMRNYSEAVFVNLRINNKKTADTNMAAADQNYSAFLGAMDIRHSVISSQHSELFLMDARYRRGLSTLVTFGMMVLGALSGLLAVVGTQLAINARRARLSVIQSQSDLLRSEETLMRLNKELEGAINDHKQFVSDAAHQLRTPLTGIQLQADRALCATSIDDAQVAIEQVKRATERASQLVNQLLILASADPSSRLHHRFEAVDVVKLVQEVGLSWIPSAHAKEIEIELISEEDSRSPILGSKILLEHLVSNLLDNAIRHTPNSGHIVLSVREDMDNIVLCIEDSGAGIPSQELHKVFERFYRGAEAIGQGTGLGMAIVKEIVEMHNAEIVLGRSASLGGLSASVAFKKSGVTNTA